MNALFPEPPTEIVSDGQTLVRHKVIVPGLGVVAEVWKLKDGETPKSIRELDRKVLDDLISDTPLHLRSGRAFNLIQAQAMDLAKWRMLF